MIEFENVSFSYTGQEHGGLHDINLKISDGECVLFCGRSGCGKTTITRLVNGLIPQFYQGDLHGRVLVDGQEISNIPMYQIAAKVGSVFQNPRTQFFNVDTDSEIAFGIENEARPPEKLAERVEQTTEDLHIQKLRNRNIFELSGGEKQKIAFASVYAMNPQIYLLDEPSSNLDMTSIQELREHLQLIKKQGKTVLIAEHRLYYLMELADRIVYLEKGEIKGIYTPEEFRQLSEHEREHMGLRAVDLQAIFPPKAHLPALTPVLELRNVTLRYKKQTILHDIVLSAGKGEVIGVVGHNGAGMIAAAVTLRFVLFGCSGVAAHKGAYGALFKVRCMVAEHMARAPLGALNERRTGDIKTVLNEDIEKLELFLAHNLPDLVCYLVGPVVIFIYLITVNVPLALISLVPLVLAVVVMGIMFRNTDDLMERANQSITALNSVMIEYISGMKLIKAYNMGSKSFRKLSDAIQEENAMWNETSRRMGPPYAAFVVIIECGMLLMVPIGGMFFLKGSLTASALLLFVYVGSMYLTEIRPLQELGTNFANVLNAITKTKEILDIPIYEGGTDFPQKHDIELRNVRFSYDGKTDVLHGVNLKIHDGERMALVGRSGAGKSTVIELISRFYDVQEGEVLIGGKNVKELDYDTILKNIAIVFQKTFLTRDSVLENIRMGSNATLEEVRAASKEAQIDDFIMSLPDGYDTKVGSFGSRFSGGEKQRIAIARAILKNAPILILDEATSASDPENQMEIDKAIQNLCKGKTVIVVAHRLSALKMCNRVAVVENHTITSVGTHEEVRKNNAYYRKAWDDYETARNITYQLEGGEQHE